MCQGDRGEGLAIDDPDASGVRGGHLGVEGAAEVEDADDEDQDKDGQHEGQLGQRLARPGGERRPRAAVA